MAINIKKWRLPTSRPKLPHVGAIGEPDAHVFNCPKCARPLSEGTPRCPGCGTRLIMGVVFRRAATLMGFGLIIGMFLGGVVMSVVITTLLPSSPAAVATVPDGDGTTTPLVSARPNSSAVPVVPDAAIPAAALSALRQSSLLDMRIVSDAKGLSAAYKSKASAVDIALIMRSLASDAAIGDDLATQLNTWDTAKGLAADRVGYYAAISRIAHDALRDSMTDKKAYRSSAKSMLAALKGLAALDGQSRAVAMSAGIELPEVELGVLAP